MIGQLSVRFSLKRRQEQVKKLLYLGRMTAVVFAYLMSLRYRIVLLAYQLTMIYYPVMFCSMSLKFPDECVLYVRFDDHSLIVDLMDGRTISAPLTWYPRLANATAEQLGRWEACAGGYGIHWPDLDEDLSTEGLLRGAPATKAA